MEWIKIFDSGERLRKRLTENKPQLMVVHGKRICLVMRDKVIFAVEDTCPHNGESLSKGAVNYLGEVVCPWHGYRFQLRTGREAGEQCRDLQTYPIKEDDSGFYIAT
jgi:nitrite reductase/ring-hydroxylating ferredoxin subunit